MMAFILIFIVASRIYFSFRRQNARDDNRSTTIAFFHPYANSGGGGERVLWIAIKALLQSRKKIKLIIYTGDKDPTKDILEKTNQRFGVELGKQSRLKLIRLKQRKWIEAEKWPRFTMLGQSIGSMILAWEAVVAFTPDIFVDTTGLAFSFPVARILAGCKVAAYVHYPTISTDMLQSVVNKRPSYNNDQSISSSILKTKAKLVYYHFFALLYRMVGKCCNVVMANSSWTASHIRSLWGKASIVYPPCDTSSFASFPFTPRLRCVVSVGQYRPEKDQALQIRALKLLHHMFPSCQDVSLVLIGSCRHENDHKIADKLEALAMSLGFSKSDNPNSAIHDRKPGTVQVLRNVSYDDLKCWLGRATAGIHTMYVYGTF